MIKRLFLIALGIAGALEAEKLLEKAKLRVSPSALTGSLLDKVNQKLESSRS
jgi:hypothetical protein